MPSQRVLVQNEHKKLRQGFEHSFSGPLSTTVNVALLASHHFPGKKSDRLAAAWGSG